MDWFRRKTEKVQKPACCPHGDSKAHRKNCAKWHHCVYNGCEEAVPVGSFRCGKHYLVCAKCQGSFNLFAFENGKCCEHCTVDSFTCRFCRGPFPRKFEKGGEKVENEGENRKENKEVEKEEEEEKRKEKKKKEEKYCPADVCESCQKKRCAGCGKQKPIHEEKKHLCFECSLPCKGSCGWVRDHKEKTRNFFDGGACAHHDLQYCQAKLLMRSSATLYLTPCKKRMRFHESEKLLIAEITKQVTVLPADGVIGIIASFLPTEWCEECYAKQEDVATFFALFEKIPPPLPPPHPPGAGRPGVYAASTTSSAALAVGGKENINKMALRTLEGIREPGWPTQKMIG